MKPGAIDLRIKIEESQDVPTNLIKKTFLGLVKTLMERDKVNNAVARQLQNFLRENALHKINFEDSVHGEFQVPVFPLLVLAAIQDAGGICAEMLQHIVETYPEKLNWNSGIIGGGPSSFKSALNLLILAAHGEKLWAKEILLKLIKETPQKLNWDIVAIGNYITWDFLPKWSLKSLLSDVTADCWQTIVIKSILTQACTTTPTIHFTSYDQVNNIISEEISRMALKYFPEDLIELNNFNEVSLNICKYYVLYKIFRLNISKLQLQNFLIEAIPFVDFNMPLKEKTLIDLCAENGLDSVLIFLALSGKLCITEKSPILLITISKEVEDVYQKASFLYQASSLSDGNTTTEPLELPLEMKFLINYNLVTAVFKDRLKDTPKAIQDLHIKRFLNTVYEIEVHKKSLAVIATCATRNMLEGTRNKISSHMTIYFYKKTFNFITRKLFSLLKEMSTTNEIPLNLTFPERGAYISALSHSENFDVKGYDNCVLPLFVNNQKVRESVKDESKLIKQRALLK